MTEVPHLIDLRGIKGLSRITVIGSVVDIGAMTTQYEVIASATLTDGAQIMKKDAL